MSGIHTRLWATNWIKDQQASRKLGAKVHVPLTTEEIVKDLVQAVHNLERMVEELERSKR